MRLAVIALLVLALLSPAYALTNINSCTNLNVTNEVYNLTADIGCSGTCSCINIDASNVTLQCNGFLINGSGYVFPYNYGINFTSVSNITIKDCRVTDFVYGIIAVISDFSNITNNTLANNSIGIGLLADSDNNTVHNNFITGYSYGDGWGITTNSSSNYNLISNNTVSSTRYGVLIEAPDNNLTNNDLRNNLQALLVTGQGVPCRNYVDSTNIAGDSGDPIYFIYDSSGATIENSGSYGEILLCNVSNSVVRNITMDDDDGIILSFSNNNQLYNNSIAGAFFGFYSYFSDSNSFFNNTISSNTYAFTMSGGSDYNVMCNNTLSSNMVGFDFSGSQHSTFCNTPISVAFGGGGGIIQYSSNNTVRNVTIQQAGYGFAVTYYAYDNNISDILVNVTVSWGMGGIVGLGGSSSGNTFTNTTIYTVEPMAITDTDGGSTFINTYLYSSVGNFIDASSPPNSFTNLTLAKDGSMVNFPGTFSMTNSSNSSNTNISADFVSIDTSLVPELNRSANVTTFTNACSGAKVYSLAGFPSSRSSIISGGSECLLCNIISCAGNAIQFDVPEFTGYAAGAPSGCVNLSDLSTWGTKLVNDSGILYINDNVTLCRDTYYISNYTGVTQLLEFNASNIWLNCNESILDGIDGDGLAINMTGKQNITVENCTVRNYGMCYEASGSQYIRFANDSAYECGTGFILSGTSSSQVLDCYTENIQFEAFFISGGSNNTLANNLAYNTSYYAFWLSSSTYNTLLNNSAPSAQISFYLTAGSDYNNLTNSRGCNNSPAFSRGFIFDSSHNNTLINSTACDNAIGFMFTSASDNRLTSNLAQNGAYGFYLQGTSTGNSFTDNIIYGGSDYGVFMIFTVFNNNFTNTYIFNRTRYINQWATAAQPNNFTNLTLAYNETIGIVNYPLLSVTDVDLQPATFIIGPYFVSLNDSSEPQASVPANITIYAYNCSHPVLKAPGFQTSFSEIVNAGYVYSTPASCVSGVASFNVSSFSGYAVAQAITHLNISILPSNNVIYGTEANVTCNGSSFAPISMYLNGTFIASGNSPLYNLSILAAGSYNFTCNVSETANYTGAEVSDILTVNKNTSSCSLAFSPSSPQIYGTPINASCSCTNPEASATLWRNGTDVTLAENNQYVTLPAGTWDYVCNVSESQNYTNATSTSLFTINKTIPSLALSATPGWSVSSGTTTNVSCDFSDPSILLELYRDSVPVDSGYGHVEEDASLADGSYQYVCNTTGNENYTLGTSSGTLAITVPPAPGGGGEHEEVALVIIAPDDVPAGTEMLITVERDDGVTLSGVRVVIKLGGSTLFDGYTDTWGRVFFTPASTGAYTITATRSGFLDAHDSFTVVPARECSVNDDCAYNEACVSGNCTIIPPGECGRYASHAWADYSCCADSGCAAGFACTNHECVKKEVPPEEERCTSDSQCGAGYTCSSGVCVLIPRPECMNSNDCLPGFECRSGSCVRKPVVPPTEEEIPGEEGVEGGEKGILADIANVVISSSWLILLFIALVLIWFFFYRKRKKGAISEGAD